MEAWKRLYRKKSAILAEQLFSILKELMPKRLYVKGLANVAIYSPGLHNPHNNSISSTQDRKT
ncbi:MAG: hypothetical protein QXI39_00135 [Candidatus Bathyarchaeia archaeon]